MRTVEPPPRILLVQCCHLPQFFYLGEMLRRQFPDHALDALVRPSADLNFYLSRTHPFSSVITAESEPSAEGSYSGIYFPLLNRGHRSIKNTARRMAGPRFEIDYQGRRTPLKLHRLALSVFLPLRQPDEAFRKYLLAFPHRPLGEKVLFVESCQPSLVSSTEKVWRSALPGKCEMKRLTGEPFWKSFRELRRRRFDSCVVFFSGEKGYLGLKLLPFLLRVPKILVINETGDFFYATRRGLLRFLYQRVLFGCADPTPIPRILFIQSEGKPRCRAALSRLKSARLFPESEVMVLCRRQDAPFYRQLPSVDGVLELEEGNWLQNWQILPRLRQARPDIVSAVFSGRPVFRKARILFLLLCDRSALVFNAAGDCYFLALRNLPRLLRREPFGRTLPRRTGRILFIQSDDEASCREALSRLKSPRLFPGSRITVLCRSREASFYRQLPGIDKVVELQRSGWSSYWRMLRRLRRARPDIVSAVFSGRSGFRGARILFLLLCSRPALVFNAALDCYFLRLRNVHRLLARSRDPDARVLILQTEHARMVAESVCRLRSEQFFPRARVTLVCRPDDGPDFEDLPELERLLPYPGSLTGWPRFLLKLRRSRPQLVSAIFSGRGVFFWHRIALLLVFPFRSKLIFNAGLDAYWLGLRTLPRLFREEPLLLEEPRSDSEILLIQTDAVDLTRAALDHLLSGGPIGAGRVRLLCREEDRPHFEDRLGEEDIDCWRPGLRRENLKLFGRTFRKDRDVVSAILSGRPVFRWQKLAFFFLPARNRLVFNENLDCRYLARGRFVRALRLPSLPASWRGGAGSSTRGLLKAIRVVLWLPRFFYLLGWLTVEKLRRARRLAAPAESRRLKQLL